MDPRSTDLYDALLCLTIERDEPAANTLCREQLLASISVLREVAQMGDTEFVDLYEFTECITGIADALEEDIDEEFLEL